MPFYFACEAAGASSARHSLRPLSFRCASYLANLARITRRRRGGVAAPPSSPRKRGPITTGLNGWSKVEQPQSKMGATEYGSLLSQGRHRAADNANGSRRCRRNYTMPSLPPIYRDRQSSSLPLVGRVAHREQSERCDGWGCFRKQGILAFVCAAPTRRFAPPSPQVGGISREARTRRSNPLFALLPWIASRALAMTASNLVSLLPRIDSRCMVIEYNYSTRAPLSHVANSTAPWLHAMPD